MELTGFLQFTFLFGTFIYVYQLYIKACQECEKVKLELKQQKRETSEAQKVYTEKINKEHNIDFVNHQKEISKWQTEKEELHKKNLSLEQQKQIIEIEHKLCKVKNEELYKEIEKLNKKLHDSNNSSELSNKNLEKIREKIYFELNTEFEKQFVTKDLENDSLKRKLNNTKENFDEYRMSHEDDINKLKSIIEDLEKNLTSSASKIDSLDNLTKDQKHNIDELKQELDQKDGNIITLINEKEEIASNLDASKKANQKINSLLEEKSLDFASNSKKITVLEDKLNMKEKEIESLVTENKKIIEKFNTVTENLTRAKNDVMALKSSLKEGLQTCYTTDTTDITENDSNSSDKDSNQCGEIDIKYISTCVKTLLDKVHALTLETDEQRSKLEKNKNELQLKEFKANKLQEQVMAQQKSLNDFSKDKIDINQATEKIDELSSKLTEKELLIIRLRKQLKEAENNSSKNNIEEQGLLQKIADKESQIEHLTMQLNNSRKNEHGISEELSALKKEVTVLNDKIASVKSMYQDTSIDANEMKKSYQDRITTLEQELLLSKEEIDKQKAILTRNLELLRQYSERAK